MDVNVQDTTNDVSVNDDNIDVDINPVNVTADESSPIQVTAGAETPQEVVVNPQENVVEVEVSEGGIGAETDPIFTASEASNFEEGDKEKLDTALQAETDPVFIASEANNFEAGDKSKLDTALQTESDPVFVASEANNFEAGDKSKLDTALQAETDPVFGAWDKDYDDMINKPAIPTELSELGDDSTHRLVTDTEKGDWNGKQDALGFIPVDKAGDTMGGVLYGDGFPVVKGTEITREDGYIKSAKIGLRQVDITRNIDNEVVKASDSIYEWVITRESGLITEIEVNIL